MMPCVVSGRSGEGSGTESVRHTGSEMAGSSPTGHGKTYNCILPVHNKYCRREKRVVLERLD